MMNDATRRAERATLWRVAATAVAVLLAFALLIAAAVTPGQKISGYPHTNQAPDSALIIIAATNLGAPPFRTNYNIQAFELFQQATNGLASITYVNENGTVVSNVLVTLISVTTSNGLVTFVSTVIPRTNQTMLVLQGSPMSGSQWYVGSNAVPVTNDTRSGFEVNMPRRSMRMGELADAIHPTNLGGQATNYWNDTNLGPVTVALGSNVTARAAYSSVSGGAMNIVLTNSKYSAIGGGYNNLIDTNSSTAHIGGGGFNQIYGRPTAGNGMNSTIGGGSNNIINGDFTRGAFIGGGGDNSISTDGNGHAVIAGGFGNSSRLDGQYSFLGGGFNNTIGDNATAGDASYAVLCGGNQNTSRGIGAFIGGGNANNHLARDNDYSVIVGGQNNDIGIAAGELESKYAFIGGGLNNDINADCTHGVIVGGADNALTLSSSNSFIGAGRFNIVGDKFSFVIGGERNTVNAPYAGAIGSSNTVTAARGIAIGTGVTVASAGQVVIGNVASFTTSSTIAGAGTGSTNYTLQAILQKMNLGSSNVNIVAVMQTTAGQSQRWRVAITNDSPDTWGFSASSVTNRWFWQGIYGTNQPTVLTNDTRLVIDGESEGTNTWATYNYFRPAK